MAKPSGKVAYTRMDEMTAEDFAVLQAYKDAYPPDPAGMALDMLAGLEASEDAHGRKVDRNMRECYRGHPCYQKTIEFCDRWDQRAFDPDYDTLPLSAFEPMVRRLFAAPRWRVN